MKINKNILFLVIVLAALAIVTFLAYRYFYVKEEIFPPDQVIEKMPPVSPSITNVTSTPVATGFKIYHNEEFGFEFQYPQDWSLHENVFNSPFSKFNLIGTMPGEKVPDTITPSLLINVVTTDFADRASISFKNLNAIVSEVIVSGVKGTKYEYKFSGVLRIAVDLPFGGYRLLLGANKEYENIFNQILATFKFLK